MLSHINSNPITATCCCCAMLLLLPSPTGGILVEMGNHKAPFNLPTMLEKLMKYMQPSTSWKKITASTWWHCWVRCSSQSVILDTQQSMLKNQMMQSCLLCTSADANHHGSPQTTQRISVAAISCCYQLLLSVAAISCCYQLLLVAIVIK